MQSQYNFIFQKSIGEPSRKKYLRANMSFFSYLELKIGNFHKITHKIIPRSLKQQLKSLGNLGIVQNYLETFLGHRLSGFKGDSDVLQPVPTQGRHTHQSIPVRWLLAGFSLFHHWIKVQNLPDKLQ